MKIINKQDFYKLPEGTLYSDYEPIIFSGLKIKGATIFNNSTPIDFFHTDLIGNIKSNSSIEFTDKVFEAQEKNISLELNFDISERDGLYEEDSLYAIYENQDLSSFIERLKKIEKK